MIQELLYRFQLLNRPYGSKLGEKEPTGQEKMRASFMLEAYELLYPIGGGDCSRWQGKIDWGMWESQLYFAFIQSSYGAAGIDSAFRYNLAQVQKRDVAFGLYHYLKPSADFRKTAQLFYDCWKDSGSQLPPAFDIEQNDGLDKNALNNWMEKILKEFNNLAGKEILKVAYSSKSFVDTYLMTTATFDWIKYMDWWIASWTTGDKPALPTVFSKFAKPKWWEWWQYSSKGIGPKYGTTSPALDLNRSFCKTLAEFNAKYGVNLKVRPFTPPPPPPPPAPDITPLGKMMVRTPGGLSIRSGPGTKYPVIGALPYQAIVTPIQIDGSSAWVEIAPDKWVCVTLDSGGQHLRFLDKV